MTHVGLPAHPGPHATQSAAELWLPPGSVTVPYGQAVQAMLALGTEPPELQAPSVQCAHPAPPKPGAHTELKDLCGVGKGVVVMHWDGAHTQKRTCQAKPAYMHQPKGHPNGRHR